MYTVDETGVMNAYAIEPEVYFAQYPTPSQQKSYWIQAILSILFITAMICIAVLVS